MPDYPLLSELLNSLDFDKLSALESYYFDYIDEPHDHLLIDFLNTHISTKNSNSMVLLARLYFLWRYPSLCHCSQIQPLLETASSLNNIYGTFYLAQFLQYSCPYCGRPANIDTSVTLLQSLLDSPLYSHIYPTLINLYLHDKKDPDQAKFYTIKYFKSGGSLDHPSLYKDGLIEYLIHKLQKKNEYCAKLKSKVLKYKYHPGGSKFQELQLHFQSLIPI